MEWMLLEAIAKNNLLVASGFAEGDPHGNILAPNMTLEKIEEGYVISGVKRPCSLSQSMDLICVSMVSSMTENGDHLAMALISADAHGICVRPFWQNQVLSGAETGEVHFERVTVDSRLLSYSGPPNSLDRIQTRGLIWFQLLISSAYIGIASALVESILRQG